MPHSMALTARGESLMQPSSVSLFVLEIQRE
jgi:hypothetical protein